MSALVSQVTRVLITEACSASCHEGARVRSDARNFGLGRSRPMRRRDGVRAFGRHDACGVTCREVASGRRSTPGAQHGCVGL
eukprot:2728203-Pleurochrysis_carterae.AAC.1